MPRDKTKVIARRGRSWTVEAPEPGGMTTMSGGEAAGMVTPTGSAHGHVGRKMTAGAEAVREGVGRARAWNTRKRAR